MDGHAVIAGGEHAQLLPAVHVLRRRQPAGKNTFEFGGVHADDWAERGEIDRLGALAGFFERGQFGFGKSSGRRGDAGGEVENFPAFADDVAKMVFELHAETLPQFHRPASARLEAERESC